MALHKPIAAKKRPVCTRVHVTDFNNNNNTHTHTHTILVMAPSRGLPSLDEFLQLPAADVQAWSDTKVIQACFEYGLVAEGDNSGRQPLRERLVELLQSLADKPPHPEPAGPSSQGGVGQADTNAYSGTTDGSLSSASGLLLTPGGQFVTPPASRGGVDPPVRSPLSRLRRGRLAVPIEMPIPSPLLWTLRTRLW